MDEVSLTVTFSLVGVDSVKLEEDTLVTVPTDPAAAFVVRAPDLAAPSELVVEAGLGGIEGLLPSPRRRHRRPRAMATSGVTSTISAPTDGTRPLPVRPQSRTPALHRLSGQTSGEAPGRPPAHAVCVLRSKIGHQQPLVRRVDELAVRYWDKRGLFGIIERP